MERTAGWLDRHYKILVHFEKKSVNFEGLIELARVLPWYRRFLLVCGAS